MGDGEAAVEDPRQHFAVELYFDGILVLAFEERRWLAALDGIREEEVGDACRDLDRLAGPVRVAEMGDVLVVANLVHALEDRANSVGHLNT